MSIISPLIPVLQEKNIWSVKCSDREVNWQSLEERHKIARLAMVYKIHLLVATDKQLQPKHTHTYTHTHTHTLLAPCGLRGSKNRPAQFFCSQISYKATKPGSVCPVS